MLSILIPTYNYSCLSLVDELHTQAKLLNIAFEIICIDDGSHSPHNNKNINDLKHASFIELRENIGRSAIRNRLVQKSKYDHLLFLDADVFPKKSSFLKSMLLHISKPVVFGGIECSIKHPNKNSLLRWKYTLNRECKKVKQREKNSHFSFTSACFFIQKNVFEHVQFDESLTKYGCEDVLFAFHLMQNKFSISHINNPVYHNNIETSVIFINKTKLALTNLEYLIQSKKLPHKIYNITRLHFFLETCYLKTLFGFIFRITHRHIIRNLISKKPSLILFDFYKLGYFNSISK